MGYTENKKADIIEAIRQEVNERAEELSYAKTREIFRTQLEAICVEYGCQFLGFNLVRKLHKEYGAPVQGRDDLVSINGITFARDDVVKPSAISDDDKDKYAGILANITCSTDLFPMSEDLAASRFGVLLKENLYLEDDLQAKRDVSRKDILNIARGLGFSLQDTNELLFRTLECGVLTDISATDLIERFIIENNQSIMEREQMLVEYKKRTKNIAKTEVDKRKENITQTVCDKFVDEVLSANKELTYEECKVKCLNYLVKNARFLDAPNRTAMHMYRKLLCYIRNAMNGEYKGSSDEKAIFERLKYALITSDECVLSEEEQILLVQTLLESENCDTLEEAYTSWAVPSVNKVNGEMAKIELGSRLEGLLCGYQKVQIQKTDILFALFLACSLEWEYNDITDIEVLHTRLNRFINLANEVLNKAYLVNDRFYLPHPLESSIAIAIMCGPLAEGVFRDVTSELQRYGERIKTNSELARIALPPKVEGETNNLPKIGSKKEKDYKNLHGSIMNAMHQLRHGVQYNEIFYEAAEIAQKIRDVWKNNNFRSIDIYFSPDGTWGYIPAVSIGKNYKQVGKTPSIIQGILYSGKKLETVFYGPAGEGRDNYLTLQKWIDEKIPDLDEARVVTLHRKAVIYILLGQLEVYCDSAIWRSNKSQEDVDMSELIKKYGGKAGKAPQKEAPQKLVLKCKAQVMGSRLMKINGIDMATLEITDKPKKT